MSDFDSTTSVYKNSPVISLLDEDGKRVLTFGLKKAKAIIDRIEDIEAFVKANTPVTKVVLRTKETDNELEQTEVD